MSVKTIITNFHDTSIMNGAALSLLELSNIRLINQSTNQRNHKIPVLSLNSINSIFKISNSDYFKIDVDGLEYEILLETKYVFENLN